MSDPLSFQQFHVEVNDNADVNAEEYLGNLLKRTTMPATESASNTIVQNPDAVEQNETPKRFKSKFNKQDQVQVQISYSDDGSTMYLKTPWSKEFVGALKVSIPHQFRKWNSLRKIWEVSGGYHSVAQSLVDTYYEGKIESIDANPDADLYRQMFLIPGAPKEIITAVYVALGGLYSANKEFSKMTELVSTYGSIMEHIEKKAKEKK